MRISDWSSDVCSSDLNAPIEFFQWNFFGLCSHGVQRHAGAQQGHAYTQPKWEITGSHAGRRTHGIFCCAQGKAHPQHKKHDPGPEVLFILHSHVDEISMSRYRYVSLTRRHALDVVESCCGWEGSRDG